jgi:hypothetical protein
MVFSKNNYLKDFFIVIARACPEYFKNLLTFAHIIYIINKNLKKTAKN